MATGEMPPDLLWEVTSKTAVVLAVLYGALWVFRRSLVRGAGGRRVTPLTVIQSAHLGPGRSVHLLGIGDRRLLVGATSQRVSLLAEVSPTDTDAPLDNQTDVVPFRHHLRRAASTVVSMPSLLKKGHEKGGERGE